MMASVALGIGIWTLAAVGAWMVAGPVGLVVFAAFFLTAGILGILHQRDLDEKYVVMRKSKDGE